MQDFNAVRQAMGNQVGNCSPESQFMGWDGKHISKLSIELPTIGNLAREGLEVGCRLIQSLYEFINGYSVFHSLCFLPHWSLLHQIIPHFHISNQVLYRRIHSLVSNIEASMELFM